MGPPLQQLTTHYIYYEVEDEQHNNIIRRKMLFLTKNKSQIKRRSMNMAQIPMLYHSELVNHRLLGVDKTDVKHKRYLADGNFRAYFQSHRFFLV